MTAPRAKAGQPFVNQPMLDLHSVTQVQEKPDMPVQYAEPEENPFTGWALPLSIVLFLFCGLVAAFIAGYLS